MAKNSKTFIVVLFVAFIVGGLIFSLQNQKTLSEDQMMKKDEDVMENTDSKMTNSESDSMMGNNSYIVYKSGVLNEKTNKKRVLFFYANWCPICRPADADIKSKVSDIPANLEIIRVNYDDSDTDKEEKSLAKKYGVTYQHTFVQIDGDGNLLQKWSGGNLADILAKVK